MNTHEFNKIFVFLRLSDEKMWPMGKNTAFSIQVAPHNVKVGEQRGSHVIKTIAAYK